MLSTGGYTDLPGMVPVDPVENQFEGQIVYLDFNGAENVTYDGPITIEGIDIPTFQVPGTTGIEEEVLIGSIVASLEDVFAETGITFVIEKPPTAEYSTVFIGGDGSAFGTDNDFFGLAEQIDVGNSNRGDSAFVFSELIFVGESGCSLIDVTAHEIGHLLGYRHSHEDPATLSSDLGSLAYATDIHEYIVGEAGDLYRALFGVADTTLEYQAYLSLPTTSSWDTGNSIAEGVVDEDATTVILRFRNHFCEGGDGSELTDGLWGFDAAYTKALTSAYPEALSSFNSGVKTSAYYWLGRTMHLLQDSTVPAHVHNDSHSGSIFDGDDEYEDNVGGYTSYFNFDIAQNGWSWDFQDWSGDWSNPQALWDRSDDYGALESLFRETTDYTDDYDSDDYPGDWHNSLTADYFSIARLNQLDRSLHADWANSGVNPGGFDDSELTSAEVLLLARDLGTWAVEQSVMLMRYFYDDLGEVVSNPTNIEICGASSSSIEVNWDSVSGADGYVLYRSAGPDSGFSCLGSTFSSNYSDTGLEVGTTYYYRIYAYNDVAGLGNTYSSISATTLQPPVGDANRDGTVDHADSAIVSDNWLMQTGATWADGDFNGDGRVDDIDTTLMAANWQRTVIPPTTSASAAVEPEVEAVSYDLDNNGRIGLGDLAVFASVYRQQPGITSDSSYAYAADFDGSGTVDLGDLALFAANYRLDRPADPIVSSTAPQTALTMAAEPVSMPGAANFDDDGRVSDDVAILARHWMMTVEDLDKEDDARRAVFADSGASRDLIMMLIDE